MAGLGAARMVAKPIADQLIKKGIGKKVSKGVGRPISKVDDLPATAQKMMKGPAAVEAQKASVKKAGEIAKRRTEKAAATRVAKLMRYRWDKTPTQIEATKINKALARGRKKTKEQRDELVPDKLDPDKFDKMMKMMDEKDKLARQAITGKRKAGGKVKGYKKGGPITYRMAGGQVVDNSYD